jgi:hypothetical protein
MRIFLITILITCLNIIKGEITMNEFIKSLEYYPEEGNFNSHPKLFIFMKIIPPKTKKQRRKIDYNGKIIENFISSLGVRNEVLNIENKHYVSVINLHQKEYFEKELILETFKDFIEKINIISPDMLKKENEDNQKKLHNIHDNL